MRKVYSQMHSPEHHKVLLTLNFMPSLYYIIPYEKTYYIVDDALSY